jgi:hypothetical protein
VWGGSRRLICPQAAPPPPANQMQRPQAYVPLLTARANWSVDHACWRLPISDRDNAKIKHNVHFLPHVQSDQLVMPTSCLVLVTDNAKIEHVQ